MLRMTMVCVCLWFGVGEAWAVSSRQVVAGIRHARKAFSRGDLAQMKRALVVVEKMLQKKGKFKRHELEHYVLWLHLLWSKYYRARGLLPPIKSTREYGEVGEVKQQLKQLKGAGAHLQKALFHLQNYNRLFRRLTRRIGVKDAISLLSTKSQQGILHNQVSIVKLRILRLERVIRDWKAKKRRKQKQHKAERRELLRLQKMREMQVSLKQLFRKQAGSLQRAQSLYLQMQKDLRRQRAQSRLFSVLSWLGLGLGAAAVVGGAISLGLVDAWKDEQRERLLSPSEAIRAQQWGIGLLIGGGVSCVVGITLGIISAVNAPNPHQSMRGIYSIHKRYLEWDTPK